MMTERTRLISYLLCGLFSAILKNTGSNFSHPLARARGRSLNRNEPGDAIETTRHSFFDNETIFVSTSIFGLFVYIGAFRFCQTYFS